MDQEKYGSLNKKLDKLQWATLNWLEAFDKRSVKHCSQETEELPVNEREQTEAVNQWNTCQNDYGFRCAHDVSMRSTAGAVP